MPDRIADGFDFPVGRGGDAAGYYMARKMSPYGHLGDDWNGTGGGNSDYGDPVRAIADGIVVYSENFGSNWGQVIIVRHKYRENDGSVRMVDSLYGHVINRRVSLGTPVRRGQQIAQIGNNNGMYLAHLHLEIRRNTDIGIQSWNFSKGLSNYCRPDQFIAGHRPGKSSDASLRLAAATPPTPSPVAPAAPAPVAEVKPVVAAASIAAPVPVRSAPMEVASASVAEPVVRQGYFVAYVAGRETKTEKESRPDDGVYRGTRKSKAVVNELPTASKGRRTDEAEGQKAEVNLGLFASLSHPERQRMRRGGSTGSEVDQPEGKSSATDAKQAASRRRSFGKQ